MPPNVSGQEHAGGGGVHACLDQYGGEDLPMVDACELPFIDGAFVPNRCPHFFNGGFEGFGCFHVGYGVVEPCAVEAF